MSNTLFKSLSPAEQYVNTTNSKLSCKVATTENITLSGQQTIDGISIIAGDRVLVKNQSTGSENGIYVCSTGQWFRATDMNSNETCRPNSFIFIEQGSMNANKLFQLTTDSIVLDTTNLLFEEYVVSLGLDVKESCRLATTDNIPSLSGIIQIDGPIVAAGDRILVKNQSTPSQNGIYLVQSGNWTRASDFDSDNKVSSGAFTFIEEGNTNTGAGFVLTGNNDIVIGTTGLTFVQFSGAGEITAGNGLDKSGNTLSVDITALGITDVGSGKIITSPERSKLNGIEALATADQTASEIRTLVESASNSNVFTDADHSKLNGIEASANNYLLPISASGTLGGIKVGNNLSIDANGVLSSTDTNTTYSVGDGGLTQNNFTDTLKSKLDTIEASADVTDATNVAAAGALMDSEMTDLAGVKGVTISTLQVKPSEGAFADGDKTKLDTIEASADVTDATNVAAAGALMDSEMTDLAGVKGVTISTLQVKPSEGAFANGDKTKLDGIETSATADQTAAEIRTLVESASDSNVFTDADHTKLNGAVINTGNETIGGEKTFSGGVFLSDNVKAAFGDGPDLEIYHNGSDSYIDDIGTGTLKYRSGTQKFTNADSSKTMAIFNAANSVDLFYNNSKKLETTNTGVSISGGLSVSGSYNLASGDIPNNAADTGGTAAIATSITASANNSANETVYLTFVDGATGTQGIETDTGLTYNPSSGILTTTSVTGNLTGTVLTATQGAIDHGSLANLAANEHIDHSSVSITAGNGLTGGGTIAANRTLNIGAGTGIDVAADSISVNLEGTELKSTGVSGTSKYLRVDGDGSCSWQTITISDSTTSTKGISSFNNSYFNVSSGAVSLKHQGITGNEIKDATIGGTKLMSSIKTITCGGETLSLGGTIANPQFDLSQSSNYEGTRIKSTGESGGSKFLREDGDGSCSWQSVSSYTLPSATSSALGGVKIGYTENNKNYPVELSSEKMFVNVPWSDTNTTYTNGSGLDLNSDEFSVSATQTKISSIKNTGLVLGRDDHNQIKFSTDNKILFRLQNEDEYQMVTDTFSPVTSGGAHLGNYNNKWQTCFLNESLRLHGGATGIRFFKTSNQDDITLEKIDLYGLSVKNMNGGDNIPVIFKLKSSEGIITSGEVIGSLEFYSSDSSGGVADGNCACICAVAEGTFTSTTNPTKLVFTTGVAEDASLVTNASVTEKMSLSSSGALSVVGDITALTSDKRLKKNIESIKNPLEKIKVLSGFTYDWSLDKCREAGFIPKDERQIGVFAQDVQSVIPEAVKPAPFDTIDGKSKSDNNYLTVQYEKIVPLLIESIKEQQKMIEDLQGQIDELKK